MIMNTKRIIGIFVLLSFSTIAMAQASGGQIRRKPQQTTVQHRSSKPAHRKLAYNEALLEDGKTVVTFETTKAVNLGLPSGTVWAGWNIDANSPTEIGGFYAWGETSIKSYYYWDNYFDTKTYKISSDGFAIVTFKEYGGNNEKRSIIGTDRDVARVKWGSPWKMPSREQLEELVKICSIHKVTIPTHPNGRFYLFTGPNGRSLLVPLTGEYFKSEIRDTWHTGYLFWSGELKPKRLEVTQLGYFGTNLTNSTSMGPVVDSQAFRFMGYNVRAVY